MRIKTILALFAFGFFLLASLPSQAQKSGPANKPMAADAVFNHFPAEMMVERAEIEASVDEHLWRLQLETYLQAPIEKAVKKGMKPGQYTVNVRFLVEKDGSLSDVKALNDPGYSLAEACVKAIKTSPRWTAGEIEGHKVRSYHTQPISFIVQEK